MTYSQSLRFDLNQSPLNLGSLSPYFLNATTVHGVICGMETRTKSIAWLVLTCKFNLSRDYGLDSLFPCSKPPEFGCGVVKVIVEIP